MLKCCLETIIHININSLVIVQQNCFLVHHKFLMNERFIITVDTLLSYVYNKAVHVLDINI